MKVYETQLRVRYAETDRMGYVYYGQYLTYLEVARTEAIREMGVTYRELEDVHQVMLPVAECALKYRKAARYDDMLTLRTTIPEKPGVRFRFNTHIFNTSGEVLVEGFVVLVFVDSRTMQPRRPPSFLVELFES